MRPAPVTLTFEPLTSELFFQLFLTRAASPLSLNFECFFLIFVCELSVDTRQRHGRTDGLSVTRLLGGEGRLIIMNGVDRQVRTTQDRCSDHPISRLESTALRTDRVYFLVYRTILYVIFRSVGPLFIIVVLNVRLAAALNVVRHRRRRLLSTGARRARDHRSNMTMMLLVVVSMFVVCELPDVGLRLAVTVYEFESTVRLHLHAVRHAHVAFNALHVVNASVNFIIYCLVGRKFRRLLVSRLTGCRPPTITVSEEVAEDWAAGTPAGDGGSECENVAMVPMAFGRGTTVPPATKRDIMVPPATGTDAPATTNFVRGTVDECVIVVHQPQGVNTALTTAAVVITTSD